MTTSMTWKKTKIHQQGLSGKSGSPSGSNGSNGSEFVLMIIFFTEASQERETTEVNSWEEAICGG